MITGSGFTGLTSVTIGGTSASPIDIESDELVEVMAPGGSVGDHDVVLSNVYETVTVTDGFRYTGTATGIDSAFLPNVEVLSGSPPNGVSAAFTGGVTKTGVTESAGASSSIVAEVGLGPQGFSPVSPPDSWAWFSASYDSQSGVSDLYSGQVTPPTYGSYSVTFRFSDDGGLNWTYADATPSNGSLDLLDMSALNYAP